MNIRYPIYEGVYRILTIEHTLLFASANKNPPTDGLGLADIGTLPAAGAWLA